MKILNTQNSEVFQSYDLEKIAALKPVWFVYKYNYGSWEGSGFAIWKAGGKYFYSSLGHCSCNGPLEDIRNCIPYDSLEEVYKVIKNYDDDAKEVMEFIKKKRWK